MLEALEQWIGRAARRPPLSADALARYAPLHHLTPAELKAALRQLEQRRLAAGLVDDPLPAERLWFLAQGSLQLHTRSGFVLTLDATGRQARYPLPAATDLVSLYAAQAAVLLGVPRGVATASAAAATAPTPQLDDAEASALERLRRGFERGQCELPSLPDLALRIGRAIDDPGNRNQEIARLIQLDPALTARLLGIVNSAAFGGPKKITGINQATTRLGRTRVRSLVYSCLLRSIFKINSRSLERRMQALWQRSVHVAALSFVLGRETPGIDAEQAMLAGLTHDIGSVAVIGSVGRYPELTRRSEVLDYAIARLRVEAGIQSVRQWGLQGDLETVIREAGQWQRIGSAVPETVDVVNLALLHALIGSPRQVALPRIDQVPAFDKLAGGRLSPDHSLQVLEQAEADVREVRRLLGQG